MVIATADHSPGSWRRPEFARSAVFRSTDCAESWERVTEGFEDEMIPTEVVPGNATESIWEIMSRCALEESEEHCLKELVESKGMIYLCTPFSRAAAEVGGSDAGAAEGGWALVCGGEVE